MLLLRWMWQRARLGLEPTVIIEVHVAESEARAWKLLSVVNAWAGSFYYWWGGGDRLWRRAPIIGGVWVRWRLGLGTTFFGEKAVAAERARLGQKASNIGWCVCGDEWLGLWSLGHWTFGQHKRPQDQRAQLKVSVDGCILAWTELLNHLGQNTSVIVLTQKHFVKGNLMRLCLALREKILVAP